MYNNLSWLKILSSIDIANEALEWWEVAGTVFSGV